MNSNSKLLLLFKVPWLRSTVQRLKVKAFLQQQTNIVLNYE